MVTAINKMAAAYEQLIRETEKPALDSKKIADLAKKGVNEQFILETLRNNSIALRDTLVQTMNDKASELVADMK